MATINFLYRSTRKNAPLNIRLLFRHKEVDYSQGTKTELYIYSHSELINNGNLDANLYWKKLHKQHNTRDVDLRNKQTEVNTMCSSIENYILNAFKKEDIKNVIIDKNWLKNCLATFYKPVTKSIEYPSGLLDYYNFYLSERENNLAKQTIKNYNVVKSLLIRYEDYLNYKIKISDIDLSFKSNFEKYCLEYGYANNTIARAIQTVKTICLHAKYNGVEISYQLEKVKLKEVKVDSIYLSFDDLEKIEKTELVTDYLINARDWLVISCYIGQRVSDLMRFTSKQIREEKEKLLIEFTQKKTGKIMTVPLHPKVIEILDKRNGEFPRPISEQKYNAYIKTVCSKAKLNVKVQGGKKVETFKGSKKYRKQVGEYEKWELVSSHIGRRSFATNFYGTIPTSYLIYITGHSTENMFLTYIGKSNKDLAMEITNYF